MYPPPGYYETHIATLNNVLPITITATSSSIALSTATANITMATSVLSTPIATALLSAAATATATAIAVVQDNGRPGHQGSPDESDPDPGKCELLGSFALIVQAALGGCAVLALVYKRWRERPQRPVKIWFFDVSKQVVGSALVHVANLLMSMLSSGQFSIQAKVEPRRYDTRGHFQPNPCSFYLLNLAIDTTLGIPILIIVLRIVTALFSMSDFGQPPESIQTGNYGSPPRAKWWAKQSLIYFIGLIVMKFCVLLIFLILPWISQVGDWALRWTEGNETIQIFFVMLFFPLVMNATQYYIIDSFIKKQDSSTVVDSIPSLEEERLTGPFEESIGDENDSDGQEGDLEGKESLLSKRKISFKSRSHDYNPAIDGENSPTMMGSGSGSDRGNADRDGASTVGDKPCSK